MSRRFSNPAVRTRRGKAETFCRTPKCDTPTRDAAFVCDHCLDQLAEDLRSLRPSDGDRFELWRVARFAEIEKHVVGVAPVTVEWCPWPRPREIEPGLWESLQSVIAGERGIDYRTLGGGGASGSEKGAVATGIQLDEIATKRAAALRTVLRRLVVACMRLGVDHNAPAGWQPSAAGEVPAMAEWLSWRVAAIAFREDLAKFPDEIRRAVEQARWSVMPSRTKQDLGDCLVTDCTGRMLADRDADFSECDNCGSWVEAQLLRDALIRELEDRLVTAAEAARLSTYLGLRVDRDRARTLVNEWARRRRGLLLDPRVIDWTPGVCPWPPPTELRFRFGTVYDLLVQNEDQHNPTPARSNA